MTNYINGPLLKDIVKDALKEDIGRRDITTESIIPRNKHIKAVLLVKGDCVVCGLNIAGLIFKTQDKNIRFKPLVAEGTVIRKNKIIAKISGAGRGILTSERVVLNFLSLLCGISTRTRRFVEAVRPYKVKIMDTRKTIPGLRLLEKYAVRIGGGYNHRLGLDEMILVKDNHLKVIGGYQRLKDLAGLEPGYQVELEVKNLKEFKEALRLKPDVIMLDNMSIEDMKKAVRLSHQSDVLATKIGESAKNYGGTSHKLLIEASGRISLKNVRKVAATGVDLISIGALTHSISSVDISLEIR